MDARRADAVAPPAPPRIGESRPRPVELTAAGRALMVVAVMLFVASVVAGVLLARQANTQAADRRALVARGVTTTGLVARLWNGGDNQRRVRYQFVVDGRRYEHDATVSSERRRALSVGSAVDVRYLPDHPAVSDLGVSRAGLPIALSYVFGGALASVGVLCLIAVNRERQLLSEGRLTPATVTSHEKRHTSHGGTHRYLRYEFRLLSGAMARGRASTSRKPPAVGSTIYVVYDPDRPSRSTTYPFSLVTPAR